MTASSQTESVQFYFDPLCPWAWMTSLWIREVRNHVPINIEWKFFSLAGVNERADVWHGPLRICALAGREGGQDAIDRAYLALGRMFHERDKSFDEIDQLAQVAAPYLEEVGLDPSLATRALEDPDTLREVLTQHQDAVERMQAFGVPWIVVDGDEMGFFGPVIGELPTGDDAVKLWEHFQWIGRQPYLYELKRGGRKKMQDLPGLSARFSERIPAESASR
jgi:predicted DsbA family dithiol-disulfide isomerase